eukprot:m.146187 g.146187  ORF g.146187 m.146187 type:complete len:495 (-) comp17244_c1_seq2:133-1617(-)
MGWTATFDGVTASQLAATEGHSAASEAAEVLRTVAACSVQVSVSSNAARLRVQEHPASAHVDESLAGFRLAGPRAASEAEARTCTVFNGSVSWRLSFATAEDVQAFVDVCSKHGGVTGASEFSADRDESSVSEYFRYYGSLSQQQNMLSDYTRTGTYQNAMLLNSADFQGKVVCDIGAGTGILSYFAVQAGAKKVYAVEASEMAVLARSLAENNGLGDRVVVIQDRVEDIELPEQVDMLISEPMGIMLLNERMIESYLHARKWLKPEGKMFPGTATMFVCPFSDEQLFQEASGKSQFWTCPNFFGLNLSCLAEHARREYFRQPQVETIDPRCLVCEPAVKDFDLLKMDKASLDRVEIPIRSVMPTSRMIHGLASWFDVQFPGSTESVWLSTGPHSPPTHWYQVRLLFQQPILVSAGQTIVGNMLLCANRKQSYDVTMELRIEGTDTVTRGQINLKEPNFRFSSFPTTTNGMPSDYYFQSEAAQAGNMETNDAQA